MTRPANATEAEAWVKRALSGDRGAQRELAAHLSPIIRARIARRLRSAGNHDRALIEDVAQECWSQLFDPARPILGKWDSTGMSLENYVGRAAEWQASQRLRADRATKRFVQTEALDRETSAGVDIEGDVAGAQLAEYLLNALRAELPPRGQLILELLYRDQLTPDEIAETLGANRQVVYNWQHQIRSRAREILARQRAADQKLLR